LEDFSRFDPQLDAWIDAHRTEIVEKTQGLLRIPSVKDEPAPDAPFGVETRRALDYVVDLAAGYGLTTKNVDGYAAHAEWRADGVAADAPIVGVLAHVDVVPEGTGWSSPPYAAEIVDGYLVARGAIDDKGPGMAGFYAMLALKECGVPVTHRLRTIFGADEESGFGCVKYYFAHEEMPATGFTPDAMFPIVYAEKGIANAVLTAPAPPEGERIHIYSLSGGMRPNMVPEQAEAVLKNTAGSLTATKARLEGVVGITTEEIDGGDKLRVVAKGISAHGSTPNEGLNAVVVLCDALLLLDHQEDQVAMIQQIQIWGADTTGGTLGIAGADDVAGPLTCNLGIAELADGHLTLTFNIRYPVTWDKDALRGRLEPVLNETGFTLAGLSDQPPLYVPLDDPLSQTLLEVYRAETGDDTAPMTMGGGTYARAMTKGVAFGPSFPGSHGGGAHQADESWAIDDLIRAAKIYAKALVRLANG
jgi:succinyl-diaminopimelate desuccinylase